MVPHYQTHHPNVNSVGQAGEVSIRMHISRIVRSSGPKFVNTGISSKEEGVSSALREFTRAYKQSRRACSVERYDESWVLVPEMTKQTG
jgi:hypothetical protein